jgi:serine/threonine protein kinase
VSSRVFAATDEDTGAEVALKVLRSAAARDPATLARFKREATVLAGIDSELARALDHHSA